MKANNIDKTWLLTWETPAEESMQHAYPICPPTLGPGGPIPFERCLSYVERAPDKFILGYTPDPRRPEAIDQLEAAIEIYGVQVYGELIVRMMYDNPDALRMFRFCGEKGLPVLVHLDNPIDPDRRYPRPLWYGGGIEAFERAIQACPETTFIGHAPGFWSHISGDDQYSKTIRPEGKIVPGGKVVEMLRKYPNLYCEGSGNSGLNALNRDPEFAKDFLLEFQDRYLYGRDGFDNRLQEFLNGLGLPQEVLDKIYCGNALKIVPLKKEA